MVPPRLAGLRRRPPSASPTPDLTRRSWQKPSQHQLEGMDTDVVLDLVRDALAADAARERALFRPEYLRALLEDPNGELTPLKGNKLWQLGLLELWLQTHGV